MIFFQGLYTGFKTFPARMLFQCSLCAGAVRVASVGNLVQSFSILLKGAYMQVRPKCFASVMDKEIRAVACMRLVEHNGVVQRCCSRRGCAIRCAGWSTILIFLESGVGGFE